MSTNQPNPAEQFAKLLHRVLKELTNQHEHLKLSGAPVGRSYIFTVRASRSDTPKLVGERGKHVRALSTLVALFGRKHRVDMQFQLLEPEVGDPAPLQPFRRQEKWDSKPIEELARELANAILLNPIVGIQVTDQANYVTSFHVIASNQEPPQLIEAVREPFSVLLNAIGKTKGRVLQPDVLLERDSTKDTLTGFAPVNIG